MEGKKILLVEDDQTTVAFLDSILKKEGYDVVVAHNGKMALTLLEGMKPDLIITDVLMPEMNGFEFYRQVKKTGDTSHIPFIVLTAREDIGQAFLELDIDDFMPKPINTQKILERIKSLIVSGRTPSLEKMRIKAEVEAQKRKKQFFMIVIGGLGVLALLILWFILANLEDKKIGDDIEYVDSEDVVNSFN